MQIVLVGLLVLVLAPGVVIAKQRPVDTFIDTLTPFTVELSNDAKSTGMYIDQLERVRSGGKKDAIAVVESSGKLLQALINSEDNYFSLDYAQWQIASKFLLDLDSKISQGTGYGNLLLKSQIVEMLLESSRVWLLKAKNSDIDLKQLLNILNVMKYHLPDRLAAKFIAFEDYGGTPNRRKISATAESLDEERNESLYLEKEISVLRRQPGNEEKATNILQSHAKAANLYSLFLKPGGIYLSLSAETYSSIWIKLKLFCLTLISKGNNFEDWNTLGNEWVKKMVGDDPWSKYISIDIQDFDNYLSNKMIRFKGASCYRNKICE